jgi:hypothetical protein
MVVLASCSGSSSSGPDSLHTEVAISIEPSSADLVAGATLQFSGTVTGSTNTEVLWTIREQGGGSISTNGMYTAPLSSGDYTVVAAAAADPRKLASATVHVTTASKPTVSGFSPGSGAPGTNITVQGTNFTGATSVSFGATPALYSVSNATQVLATVPGGVCSSPAEQCSVPISVVNLGGVGASSGNFTVLPGGGALPPSISGFAPSSGIPAQMVTIAGANFVGTTSVTFNGTSASYIVTDAGHIAATVPANATSGAIVVTTPIGTATSAGNFTVLPPVPVIDSLSSYQGAVGDPLTITGDHFTSGSSVTINGAAASVSSVSSTQIQTSVPNGVTYGDGFVSVTTPGGTAWSPRTYRATPPEAVITGLSQLSGYIADRITITGRNFVTLSGPTAVRFGTRNAFNYTVVSDQEITATVPAQAGTAPVSVTTFAGTATSTDSFTSLGTFSEIGGTGAGGSSHTATLLGNEKVLVAGGVDGTTTLTRAELYDPSTESFGPSNSQLNEPRAGHTATLLQNGQVLIAGGGVETTSSNTAELYDPDLDTFTPIASPMIAARRSHTANLLTTGPDTGKVLIAGGLQGSSTSLDSAELYDPGSNSFQATSGLMTVGRSTHTATVLDDGRVLLTGGSGSSAGHTAELYDPNSGTFAATGGNSFGVANRSQHTATRLPNGTVVIEGGTTTGVAALIFDPQSGNFRTLSSTALGSQKHAAVLLPNGRVLIAGGSSITATASGYYFNPVTELTLQTQNNMAVARVNHTATLLPDGTVLIVGGANGAAGRRVDLFDPNAF